MLKACINWLSRLIKRKISEEQTYTHSSKEENWGDGQVTEGLVGHVVATTIKSVHINYQQHINWRQPIF